MASIVISGDTSGAVTLAAPAVAGTPTLTLPTTSGTIVTTAGATTVEFAAGSAASPSITFTGDTNTGIFSPTADTIAFSEGGAEAMRIDSAGQVGVGVTPTTWSTGRVIEVGVSGTSLWGLSSGTSYVTAGYYYNSTDKFALTGNYALFYQLVPADGSFRWYSSTATGTAGNNATMSERMRITSTGIVGIGTSSPGGKLQVKATTNISLYVGNSGLGSMELGNYDATDGYNPLLVDGSYVAFATGTAGGQSVTERMRITSAGLVGIGTSSPSQPLDVVISGTGDQTIVGLRTTGGGGQGMLLGVNTTNTVTTIKNNTGSGYGMAFYSGSGGTEHMRITSGGFLKASNNGTYYISTGAHELRTNVNDDNIAYLTHNGNSSPYGPYVRFSAAAPNNASNYYFYCDDTSTVRFIVYSNGNVVNRNGSYGTISDAKNKENIVDATPKLDDVMQLKVRNFNFKTDPDLKQIGFVAQEFEQVFPAMVEDAAEMGDDGKPTGETSKTIKMSVLIPILTKAIQEQQAMIEELKARIETLEAK